MQMTRETFGAVQNLTIVASPNADRKERAKELAIFINHLYNYGVISNLPDDYDPSNDVAIMVQSDERRMLKGFAAMEHVKMQADDKLRAQFKGKAGREFEAEAERRAQERIAEFVETDLIYDRTPAHVYRNGEIHDYGWTQFTAVA